MSLSYEEFYQRIHKHINYAKGYSECIQFPLLVKSCRLKPLNILEKRSNLDKIYLEKIWVDEFGCAIEILENKKIEVHINFLLNKRITSTDPYGLISVDKVVEKSKVLIIGSSEQVKVVGGFDEDYYLRIKLIKNGDVTLISPLYIGTDNILENFKGRDSKLVELEEKSLLPFEDMKLWLVSDKSYLSEFKGLEGYYNGS